MKKEVNILGRQIRRGKRMLAFGIIVALLIGLSACEQRLERYTEASLEAFDTVTVIMGYDTSEKAFQEKANKLQELLWEYHRLYDIYHDYDGINNLKTINDQAGIAPVPVEDAILDMLEYGIEMYEQTGGKTNIAMGSVLALWHEKRSQAEADPEHASLPEKEDLEEAALHTDISALQIDREAGTVFLADPKLRLDVGAVAKGSATDRLAEYAIEQGWTHLTLSIGGNIRTIGKKDGEESWRVGIQTPDSSWGKSYFCLLLLDDLSLVTSGSYQRYFTVDGKQYHHIINPDTLFPENTFLSVSVVCESSAKGDALSTALFNMSLEDGERLIEEMEGTEAVWIYEDGEYVSSSGLEGKLME